MYFHFKHFNHDHTGKGVNGNKTVSSSFQVCVQKNITTKQNSLKKEGLFSPHFNCVVFIPIKTKNQNS